MSYKPCGTCDVCKEVPAEAWFGRTNAATCKASSCKNEMNKRYIKSCQEIEAEIAFEKEMEDY